MLQSRALLCPAGGRASTPSVRLLLSLLLLVALGGCDLATNGDETGVAAPESKALPWSDVLALDFNGLFFPLAQDNHWNYDRQLIVQILPEVGEPLPPEQIDGTIEREIDGTEELFDRTYVVMHEQCLAPGGSTESWIRYRQDPAGLYEADVAVSDPPAVATKAVATADAALEQLRQRLAARALDAGWLRAMDELALRREQILRAARGVSQAALSADGGVLANELLRLRYPLRPGACWPLRSDAPDAWIMTVEGRERLTLPAGTFAAWRVRLDGAIYGPEDVVRLWYSRSGELQFVLHAETEALDQEGNILGTVVYDERQVLTDLALSR